MDRFLFLMLFLLTPAITGQAQVSEEREPTSFVSIKGGMMIGITPTTLTESYNTSYSVGGALGIPVGSLLTVRPVIEFGQLAFDIRQFIENNQDQSIVTVSGGNYHALSGAIDLLLGYNRPTMIAPYGILGAGYYRGTINAFTVRAIDGISRVPEESDSGLMVAGGAGIRSDMNEQLGAFAEFKFVYGLMATNHLVLPMGVGIYLNL